VAGLRKAPGTRSELGSYEISGSLDGLEPGRRTIRMLRIRKLTGATAEGLHPLRALPELAELTLDDADGVDLSPLTGLALDTVLIRGAKDVDLGPLAGLPRLEALLLTDLDRCRVPERLTLPEPLRHLSVIIDAPGLDGAVIRALVDAIEWGRLPHLGALKLGVGGHHVLPPVQLELGFLRELPQLGLLDLGTGIWPAPDGPSLLDALPPRLGQLRVGAEDPDATAALLEQHRPELAVAVYHRARPEDVEPPWTPAPVANGWTVYGSLHAVFPGLPDEYAAAEAAETRLRQRDSALHRRLDFDPEQGGTGISAPTREELHAALAILGLHG
jgi:hypothetical protein